MTCGLVVGRFQMFHNGHKYMIERALQHCNIVVVAIGSAQESRTERNPFTYAERMAMITSVFKDQCSAGGRIKIIPLDDLGAGDNVIWGKYVLDTVKKLTGLTVNYYVTGCEKCRPSWFDDRIAPDMDELRLARTKVAVSASECRRYLLNDERTDWEWCVDQTLYDNYDNYRKIILEVNKNEK